MPWLLECWNYGHETPLPAFLFVEKMIWGWECSSVGRILAWHAQDLGLIARATYTNHDGTCLCASDLGLLQCGKAPSWS